MYKHRMILSSKGLNVGVYVFSKHCREDTQLPYLIWYSEGTTLQHFIDLAIHLSTISPSPPTPPHPTPPRLNNDIL